MRNLTIALLSIFFFAACGSGPQTDAATMDGHDHADHDHADHNHDAPAGMAEVPAVPAGAKVFFGNMEDGATIVSPAYVAFGVEGMGVEPAGLVNEAMGHHHIVIDGGFIAPGEAVPADATHIHYGGGQIGDTLILAPGAHTLTLQFADGLHRSYGEQMSATISVNVE